MRRYLWLPPLLYRIILKLFKWASELSINDSPGTRGDVSSPLFACKHLQWTNSRPSVSLPPDKLPQAASAVMYMTDCPPTTNKEKNKSQRLLVQAALYDLKLQFKIMSWRKKTIFSGFQLQACGQCRMFLTQLGGKVHVWALKISVSWLSPTLEEASVLYLHPPVGALAIYPGWYAGLWLELKKESQQVKSIFSWTSRINWGATF